MKTFTVDAKVFVAISVVAETPEEALILVAENLECADANFGSWPDGSPILGEASVYSDEIEVTEG